MKNIYIATIISQEIQRDMILIADSVASAEKLLKDDQRLERIVIMREWVIADSREEYSGEFHLADVVYDNSIVNGNEFESVQYLVQAESFADIEEIVKEETGEVFQFIRTIERSPYQVFEN